MIVDRITAALVLHGPIQRHDQRHGSVHLFRGLFLVDLEIPRRVRAHEGVVHVPAQHRVPAMVDVPLQYGRQCRRLDCQTDHAPREAHPAGKHSHRV